MAFVVGISGMLALETGASAAVGVAISVIAIPAAAFLGVALGIGKLSDSLAALGVLGANVAMMLLGGTLTLIIQRMRLRAPARAGRRLSRRFCAIPSQSRIHTCGSCAWSSSSDPRTSNGQPADFLRRRARRADPAGAA